MPFNSRLQVDNKLFKWLNFNFHALNLFFSAFLLLLTTLPRELQRIESISSAPVISHFSETILGLTTIRAYNQESRFMEMLFKRMEANNVAVVILNASNRWLGIALVRIIEFDKRSNAKNARLPSRSQRNKWSWLELSENRWSKLSTISHSLSLLR